MFYYRGTRHAEQWILQTCLSLLETLQFPDVTVTFTCSQYRIMPQKNITSRMINNYS